METQASRVTRAAAGGRCVDVCVGKEGWRGVWGRGKRREREHALASAGLLAEHRVPQACAGVGGAGKVDDAGSLGIVSVARLAHLQRL